MDDLTFGANTRYFSNSDFGLVRKNLTFNATKYELGGVQGQSIYTSLSKLSQDKLETFSKIVAKNLNLNEQSEIKTSSNLAKNYEFSNEISFKDKVSGSTINLRLSDENLSRLKTTFGSQDFDKDENGKITISGEAENFVSGWFGDIAYKRNYVGADGDKNGFLNDSEKGDTLAGYSTESTYTLGSGNNVTSVQMHGVSNYLPYNKHYDATLPNTIEKALNATLKADANMDGYLNLGELKSKQEIINLTQKNIEGKPGTLDAKLIDILEELLKQTKRQLEEQQRLNAEYEKLLNAENYATSEDFFNALQGEIEGIKSISLSLKISEELVIKNLGNPNFSDDMSALISELRLSAQTSLSVDIRA